MFRDMADIHNASDTGHIYIYLIYLEYFLKVRGPIADAPMIS